jgi:hypothetical protein
VVESDSKEVQQFREILEDTIKSAPSKNAPGGIKSRGDKVIDEGKDAGIATDDKVIQPDKDIAASVSSSGIKPDKGTKLGVDTAAHLKGDKHGKGIADGNKAVTSVALETDTATYTSRGKDPETDTAKRLEGGND